MLTLSRKCEMNTRALLFNYSYQLPRYYGMGGKKQMANQQVKALCAEFYDGKCLMYAEYLGYYAIEPLCRAVGMKM